MFVLFDFVGNDPVQKETLEEELKDLEKEKKDIVGFEANIDNAQLEIPVLVEQQNLKMQEIEKQRSRVADFQAKLETVKSY